MLEMGQLIIQIIYGTLLVFVYVFIILQIMTPTLNKQVQSPFFKIAVVVGFVDLASYIVSWIMYKFPSFRYTVNMYTDQEDFFLFPLLGFGAYFLPTVRSFLLVISSANRLTALNRFSWHGKIWSLFWKPLSILCFLLALITTFPTLFGKVTFFPVNGIIIIAVKADWDPFWRGITTACQVTGAAFLSFAFNLGALYGITKSQKTFHLSADITKAEIQLLIISFWDLVVDIIFASEQIILHFGSLGIIGQAPILLAYNLESWVMDLSNLSRPIFFMISSKALRKAFLKSMGLIKPSTQQLFIVPSSAVHHSNVQR